MRKELKKQLNDLIDREMSIRRGATSLSGMSLSAKGNLPPKALIRDPYSGSSYKYGSQDVRRPQQGERVNKANLNSLGDEQPRLNLNLPQPDISTPGSTPTQIKPEKYYKRTPTLSSAEPDNRGLLKRGVDFIKEKAFMKSDEDQKAADWQIYATSKVNDISMPEAEKKIRDDKRAEFDRRATLITTPMLAASVVSGALPLATLVKDIAVYGALSKGAEKVLSEISGGDKKHLSDFLPETSSEQTKNSAMLLGTLLTMYVSNKVGSKIKAKPIIDKLKSRFITEKGLVNQDGVSLIKDIKKQKKILDALNTLGLDRTASKTKINNAYRSLAHETHPDKFGNSSPELKSDAEKKFKEINEARKYLKKNFKPEKAGPIDRTPNSSPDTAEHIKDLKKLGLKWGASRRSIARRKTELLRYGRNPYQPTGAFDIEKRQAYDRLMSKDSTYRPYSESPADRERSEKEEEGRKKIDIAMSRIVKDNARAIASSERTKIEEPKAPVFLHTGETPSPIVPTGGEFNIIDPLQQKFLEQLKKNLDKAKKERTAEIRGSKNPQETLRVINDLNQKIANIEAELENNKDSSIIASGPTRRVTEYQQTPKVVERGQIETTTDNKPLIDKIKNAVEAKIKKISGYIVKPEDADDIKIATDKDITSKEVKKAIAVGVDDVISTLRRKGAQGIKTKDGKRVVLFSKPKALIASKRGSVEPSAKVRATTISAAKPIKLIKRRIPSLKGTTAEGVKIAKKPVVKRTVKKKNERTEKPVAKRTVKKKTGRTEKPKYHQKTYKERVLEAKEAKKKTTNPLIKRLLKGKNREDLSRAVAKTKKMGEKVKSKKERGKKIINQTKESNVERYKKAYKDELFEMKKAGALEGDFRKLYEKEFDKDILNGEVSKADVLFDFIENEYGFSAAKTLIFPLKTLETTLNMAVEKTSTYLYKKLGGELVVNAIKKMLGDTALTNKLGKIFIYDYKLPEWYKGLRNIAKTERLKGENIAEEFMRTLTKGLTEKESIELHNAIINGGRSDNPDIERRAMGARSMLDYYGEKYYKAGAISKETYIANRGSYMMRAYLDHELAKPIQQWIRQGSHKAGLKEALSRGMKKNVQASQRQKWEDSGWEVRKEKKNGTIDIWRDYTMEERKAMKEIVNRPDYLVSKGIRNVSNDVALLNMFNKLSRYKQYVKDEPYGDYLEIPNNKKYGKLKGKYVDPYIHNDIVGTMEIATEGSDIADRFVSEWKKFKVIDNPATHFRNMYFNFILSDIAGLSPTRIDVYSRALNQVIRRGDLYKEAKIGDLFGSTWSGAEMKQALAGTKSLQTIKRVKNGDFKLDASAITDVMGDITTAYNNAQSSVGKIYQGEEEWNKMALYIFAKEDLGLEKEDAIKFSKKWGLDYSAVTPTMNKFSKKWYGAPFIRFAIKSAPRLAEGVLKKPFTIAKWYATFQLMNATSRKMLGLTKEQEKEIRELQPQWQKDGLYILAPTVDKYGQFQFIDLSYIIPFTDEIQQGDGALKNYMFQNPLYKLPAELYANRAMFSGKDIHDEVTNPGDAVQDYLEYAYRSIAPNLAPWNYGFNKVLKAQMAQPDYEGRTTELFDAVRDVVFGIKYRKMNPTKEKSFRGYEVWKKLNEVEKKIKSTEDNRSMTKATRDKEIDRLSKIYEGILDSDKARELIDATKLDEAGKAASKVPLQKPFPLQ